MDKNSDTVFRPRTQSETERELFSEKKDSFLDALECLYIPNNPGARNSFADKWPDAAVVIFDDELVQFDYNGAKTDEERARRTELELMAEERRMQMLDLFDNIEARLVQQGSLQLEALTALMAELNRPIAEYLFAERFVEKYFPSAGEKALPSEDIDSEKSKKDTSYAPSPSLLLKTNTKPEAHRQIVRNIVNVSDIVPEKAMDSIGHVDHSYKASTPHYSEGGTADNEDDMSWLDTAEEDEFGDVKPIMVGESNVPPVNNPEPEPVSLQRPSEELIERHAEAAPAPIKENSAEDLPPGITKMEQSRKPAFSSGGEEVSVAGKGSVSGSLSGLGFSKKSAADAEMPIPKAEEEPNVPSPAVKADEKPAPRVPRLEDLDKHVPPIPGTEQDDY
jgi:hypothetical protein